MFGKKAFLFVPSIVAASGLAYGVTQQQAGGVQVFNGEDARLCTRILYFIEGNPPSSPGQFAIDYGQPEWKGEYDAQFDQMTKGKIWRFGRDFWTRLDTNLPLTIGGARVAPGYYYLVLERSMGNEWTLVLVDPDQARAGKLDAFQANQVKGGIKAAMNWEQTSEPATKLSVKLIPNKENMKQATLEIAWGKHKLTAPIAVDM